VCIIIEEGMALLRAASAGDEDEVMRLLRSGADLEATDADGVRPTSR
jgi:hypothetical protein